MKALLYHDLLKFKYFQQQNTSGGEKNIRNLGADKLHFF